LEANTISTPTKQKWASATLREALTVAQLGKLARHPLAQAALVVQEIDALIAEVEAGIAVQIDPLAELQVQVASLQETSARFTAANHPR
jgi:hypothetical protein